MIYDIGGNVLSDERWIEIELEGGTISNGVDSYDIASFGSYSRSALMLKTNGATTAQFDMSELSQTSVTAVFYNSNRAYSTSASYTKGTDGIANITIPSGAAFVRFVFSGTLESVKALLNAEVSFAKRIAMYSPTERFTYAVNGEPDGVCNTGRMLLPPNYDPDGEPVPLIVFGHGSQTFNTWTDEMPAVALRKYLSDEGFAFVDIFGWTSKYAVKYNNDFRGNDPLSIPLHIRAHGSAIDYVCSRYNVDKDNIHIMSKSMGGLLALYVTVHNPWNVKSVGMFAPVLDYISIRGTTSSNPSYTCNGIADELGFTGDVSDFRSNYYYDPAAVAYIEANKEAFIQNNPAWMNLVGNTLDERLAASIDNCQKYWSNISRTDIYQDLDLAQIGKVPTKIWGAADDAAIPYMKMVETVAQLNNGGCEAHMRTLPSGCGAHFATDTAYTQYPAVAKTNVTTACGVHYDSVPLAYWENIQWIRLQMGESYDIDGINPPSE